MGREIRRRIKAELNLVATVGIGPNKLVAKIASSHNKPDGFTVVERAELESFLGGLPSRALWGVGPKTERRLKEMGVETVAQLRSKNLQELQGRFGDWMGRTLYRYSRGLDESPVVTNREPKSMSRETTFEADTSNHEKIRETIEDLSKGVASHLAKSGYAGRTITLKIRYDNFSTRTRSVTAAQPVAEWREISARTIELLSRDGLARKVRLIGVRVSGLERTE
jgi:DNA polymerase-4